MQASIECLKMWTGRVIPQIGLGTYLLEGQPGIEAMCNAIQLGYRHFDTASMYGNEVEVGEATRKSGIDRKQLFITSKINTDEQGYDSAMKACNAMLKRLKMDYLDLLLIHWPGVSGVSQASKANAEIRLETWKAMIQLKKQGKVIDIGVSNFLPHHLTPLIELSGQKPVVNQIEVHPLLWEAETIEYCRKNQILIEAYSPLGHNLHSLMTNPLLIQLSHKYNKTVPQIAIRWSVQNGFIPLPKSKTKQYLQQNLQVYNFELSADEMASIQKLNNNTRTDWNPHNILI